MSSYNLNIYPDRDSCGGESVMYTYSYINKVFNYFVLHCIQKLLVCVSDDMY